jgi:DNA-binding NtrC family response regulator
MKLLELYSWPGNIRQLENVIIRTVFLAHANKISAKDLPAEIRHISGTELGLPLNSCDSIETASLPEQRPEVGQCYLRGALQEPERQLILRTLQQLQWNRSLAAEKLGINRTTLYKKMKRLGLTKTPIGRQISRQTCLKPKEQPSR